ncbi:hypothetical protein K1719_002018 [Acacia pycnantha]|nr:hypothetical protein K1719_002018 [Acacia pycnantha]
MSQMEIDGGNPVFPRDVITSILIRLPVRSLIRFQCVCKEWKNLFKTPSFIAEHLQHSAYQKPFLFFEDFGIRYPSRTFLLNGEIQVLEVSSNPFIESIRTVWTINFCNGLICLALSYVPRSLSLLVWNPATREMRLVSEAVDYCVDGNFHVGFGFSPMINDYKIVKIRDFENENKYLIHRVEVYSLNMGTWKEVELGKLDGVAIFYNGFNFNGAIFWFGSMLGADEDEDDIDFTISFDIATEVFTLIPMPPLSSRPYLTVYENRLAFLSPTLSDDFKSSLIHLWVMEEVTCTKRWCWTKKYTSGPCQGCLLVPVTIWRNEIVCNVNALPGFVEQFEDEDEPNVEQKMVLLNYTTDEFKMIHIRKFVLGYGIFNYAESLVPVGNMPVE